MLSSPFKFLDSYTKDDRAIFFGRDKEVEEIYSRLFQSKILLVYGPSGIGKTSLIQCGLANKFSDSDWLPVTIRRGVNIQKSIFTQLGNVSITPLKEKSALHENIQSVYLDHFKPIVLLFDQYEELFIFGNQEEIDLFFHELNLLLKSGTPCKIILIIRGEYLELLTRYEEKIPSLFENRIRMEKMTRNSVTEVIQGSCKAFNIELEEGFTQHLVEKLTKNSPEIELTYLQVFLDKIYKTVTRDVETRSSVSLQSSATSGVHFTNKLLLSMGEIGDVLSGFLDEQIASMHDQENALRVLKSLVSSEGTKKQNTLDEINEFCRLLGKDLARNDIENILLQLVNRRILKDKDENGKYELRHDSLAGKIYEKITLAEKEILEIRQFIINRQKEFIYRGILLNREDLHYIAPYQNKIFLNPTLTDFVNKSRHNVLSAQRLKKRINIMTVVSLFLLVSAVAFWSYQKLKLSRAKELAALALTKVNTDATLACLLAEKAASYNMETPIVTKALIQSINSGPFYNELDGNTFDVSSDNKYMVVWNEKDTSLKVWSFDKNSITVSKKMKVMEYFVKFIPANNLIITKLKENNDSISIPVILDINLNKKAELKGHRSKINGITISKDGKYFGTASDDSTLRIWDCKGKEIACLKYSDKVVEIYISYNNKFIFVYLKTDTLPISIIDAGSYKKLFEIKRASFLHAVGSLSDGYTFYYSPFSFGTKNFSTNFFDLKGKLIHTIKGCRISHPGKNIFTTQDSSGITGYSNDFNRIFYLPIKEQVEFYSGNFISPNGQNILYDNSKGSSIIYSIKEKSEKSILGSINTPEKSSDSSFFSTYHEDENAIRIYDYEARNYGILKYYNEKPQTWGIKIFKTLNKLHVIVSDFADKIKIWEIPTKKIFNKDKQERVVFSPDGNSIIYSSGKKVVTKNLSGDISGQIELAGRKYKEEHEILSFKSSPDGKYLATVLGFRSDTLREISLWKSSGNLLKSFNFYREGDRYINFDKTFSFSKDTRYFVTLTDSNKATIVKLPEGDISIADSMKTFLWNPHKKRVNSIDISPDNKWLVTASDDSSVIIWKMDTLNHSCKELNKYNRHNNKVSSARFNLGSNYILSASDDSTVCVWDFNKNRKIIVNSFINEKRYGKEKFFDAAFSYEDKYIITTEYTSKKEEIWNFINDYLQRRIGTIFNFSLNVSLQLFEDVPLLKENKTVSQLSISPDNQLICYGNYISQKLVNTNHYELFIPKGGYPIFSPDSKTLVTNEEGQLRFYSVNDSDIVQKIREMRLKGVIRNFSEEEKKEYEVE